MPQSYFSMARVKTTWPFFRVVRTLQLVPSASLRTSVRWRGDLVTGDLSKKKLVKPCGHQMCMHTYIYIYIYRISQMDEWTYRWIGNNIGKPPNAFDQFTFEWYFFGGLPHCCFSGVPKKPLVGDFSPLPPVVTSSLLWKTTMIIIDESSK